MPHKIPEPVTANELIQFFPLDMEENKLEQLAEHINYQMEVAQGAIEIDKHTIENWEVYQAIQTIKNAELPNLIETRNDDWKRYSSLAFHGQEQLEHIQQIIRDCSSQFPTKKPAKSVNSVQPKIFGYMLFDIHIECEKINPAMTWYGADGKSLFQNLAVLIAGKMGIDNDSVSDLMRRYIKDFSKPQRNEQSIFLVHMRKALDMGKIKINSPEYQKALREYQNKK